MKTFTEYLIQENNRKDLMGRATLNIEKYTVLISRSQQQSLFTSNQEEEKADTRIALHCSESSKRVFVKAKDTDISVLMVYAFAITFQIFGKTTSLCLPQFHSLIGCDTVSNFFGISKTCAFKRLLKDTYAAHLIEKLGESPTRQQDVVATS